MCTSLYSFIIYLLFFLIPHLFNTLDFNQEHYCGHYFVKFRGFIFITSILLALIYVSTLNLIIGSPYLKWPMSHLRAGIMTNCGLVNEVSCTFIILGKIKNVSQVVTTARVINIRLFVRVLRMTYNVLILQLVFWTSVINSEKKF